MVCVYLFRVNPPSFADQRLVRLEPLTQIDIEIYHALLNCTIAIFIIEGMGFRRCLGSFDLSKDRIENYFHILDSEQLNLEEIDRIKFAFAPLLNRDILDIADELDQAD